MRARRVDANHAAIKDAFLDAHCSVIDVSSIPCGFDLIVGYGGLSICVEVKDAAKSPSRRQLTANERRVHESWTGGARLVEDIEDVADTVKLLRRWHLVLRNAATGTH